MQVLPSINSAWRNKSKLPAKVKHLIKKNDKAGALQESDKSLTQPLRKEIERLQKDIERWEVDLAEDRGDADDRPDVLLDVPTLKVDEIKLKVDTLEAHVAVMAAVANLVHLNVGADVGIGEVDLDIKGVGAQAPLKVRLKHIYAILARTLETLDAHPEIMESLAGLVSETERAVGRETGRAVGEIGGAVSRPLAGKEPLKEIAKGVAAKEGPVEEAVEGVSEGIDQAVKGESNVKEQERRHFRKTKLNKEPESSKKKHGAAAESKNENKEDEKE